MQDHLRTLLEDGAKALGITLDDEQIEAFLLYLRELKRWNRRLNLTSVVEEREIVVRHFLDSLVPERFLGPEWRIVDLGSGAGFPGIPLKLARPDLSVLLVDSSMRKVAFERHIIRTLGLQGIEALHARGEDLPSLGMA